MFDRAFNNSQLLEIRANVSNSLSGPPDRRLPVYKYLLINRNIYFVAREPGSTIVVYPCRVEET